MILYSIMPPEIVFQDDYFGSQNQYLEAEYLGYPVQVVQSQGNAGEYVISRILSTEPKAFLNPQLQPGTVVKNLKIK